MRTRDLTPEQYEQYVKQIKKGVKAGLTAIQIRDEDGPAGLVSERTVHRHMQAVKAGKQLKKPDPPTDELAGRMKDDSRDDAKTLEYYETRIVTMEDALKKAKVDMSVWEVERSIVNSWEVGAKGPDGKVRVTPLWQVKVWLKKRKGWDASEFKKALISDIKKLNRVNYSKKPFPKTDTPGLLAELSIFDAHFGKLAWSPESGQDYDLTICRNRYLGAALDLSERALNMGASRFVFVVGNDFFHVDHKDSTTSGTPMNTDGRWQKAFRVGVQCCVEVADRVSAECPVDILVVPGNHDREKAFCLGEVLAARYHDSSVVSVINNPDLYSYYRWGKVLLGFVHGDAHGSAKKRAELPIQMLNDRPGDVAETVWREWHLGHFHSEAEDVWKYRSVEHVRDFAVRVLPSLSSTDAWHRQQGYKSVLAAECHIYDRDRGRWAYLVHQSDS